MTQCVYKIIQSTDEGLDTIHLCYKKNRWIQVLWSGPDIFKQKFKCCPICGNINIKEEEH